MKQLVTIIFEGLLLGVISIISIAATMAGEMPGDNKLEQLLDNAANQVEQREFDQAAATLERALRLEPKNAEIWHSLAQVRLHQGHYQQAEAMAEKSKHLSIDDSSLHERNNHVIAIAQQLAQKESHIKNPDQELATQPKLPEPPNNTIKEDAQIIDKTPLITATEPQFIDSVSEPIPEPMPVRPSSLISEQSVHQIAQPSFATAEPVDNQQAIHLQLLPHQPVWKNPEITTEEYCDEPQYREARTYRTHRHADFHRPHFKRSRRHYSQSQYW